MNIHQPSKGSLTSQSIFINSNFVSILIGTQIEIKICIQKNEKRNLNSYFKIFYFFESYFLYTD